MSENKRPTFLTKKDFFQIEECKCGKSPFRYKDISKNVYVAKCPFVKEELDIKTRKWVQSKKQPCDMHIIFCEERPVFEEVKNTLIKRAQQLPNKDSVLEEKLKLLFRFVFVSRHTSTLDEINILVKNTLHREPRKVYYFPSSDGNMRISHYEPLEEYRDRIFSEKIIDRGVLLPEQPPPPKQKFDDFFNIRKFLNLTERKQVKQVKQIKQIKQIKQVKQDVKSEIISVSKFILVSDDDQDDDDQEDSEKESDNESVISRNSFDEPELEDQTETEAEAVGEEEICDDECVEDYEDYASDGEDFYD